MKKTMKKSALLSSIAMLVVSAIVLTSATYAWFSSSKVVTVEALNAEVKVSTGLLISVDHGDDWGTKVDFADADPVKDGWGAGLPEVFDPVSTADGNTWVSAIYDDSEQTYTSTVPVPGEGGKFVAVPLWVTGPANETVTATVSFNGTDTQSAKCLKFALLPSTDGIAADSYSQAVAATANDPAGFMGVSTVAEKATANGTAFTVEGGTNISEVGLSDITFTIPAQYGPENEAVSTDNPMMFIAYLWLEGNDADCDMLQFNTSGEKIGFSMTLALPNA